MSDNDRLGGLSPEEHRAQLRRAVIASTVGTTIEWYDFLLYGTMAALVFGKLFFPQVVARSSVCFSRSACSSLASSDGRSAPRSSAIGATGSAARRR